MCPGDKDSLNQSAKSPNVSKSPPQTVWSLLHAYKTESMSSSPWIWHAPVLTFVEYVIQQQWVQWITLMFSQVTGQTRGVTLIFHMCVRGWMWQVPSLPHLLALSYLPAAPRAGVLFYTRWKSTPILYIITLERLHCSDFFFLSSVCIQMKKI